MRTRAKRDRDDLALFLARAWPCCVSVRVSTSSCSACRDARKQRDSSRATTRDMLSPQQLADLRELDSPPSSIGVAAGRKWAANRPDIVEPNDMRPSGLPDDTRPGGLLLNGLGRRSSSPGHSRSSSSPAHSPMYSRRSSLAPSQGSSSTERMTSVISEESTHDAIARRADEIIGEAQASARRKMNASRLSDEVRRKSPSV